MSQCRMIKITITWMSAILKAYIISEKDIGPDRIIKIIIIINMKMSESDSKSTSDSLLYIRFSGKIIQLLFKLRIN